mgnify:CR=1 FL=1|jgi:TetR/AcrR family transcriptional repressor of lmrAB and yxaGH operons
MTTPREQILTTTSVLLEAQGYHATGLNQIIQESGSPKGSLYYYFPGGKEELTAEALSRAGIEVLNRIRHVLDSVEAPDEAIQTFIRTLAHHVEASGYRSGGPITTVALETAASSSRLREECARIYNGWQAAFAQKLLASGCSEEQARALAGVILAAIEGGIILCRVHQSPKPLHDIAEMMGTLVLSL